MRYWTLVMTSLEQGFLAAGSSVTLSRKTTHSACPPLHMTSEPHTPPELTTWSTGSRQRELDVAAGISRCSRSFGMQRENRPPWRRPCWTDSRGSERRFFQGLAPSPSSAAAFADLCPPLLPLLPLERFSPPCFPPLKRSARSSSPPDVPDVPAG